MYHCTWIYTNKLTQKLANDLRPERTCSWIQNTVGDTAKAVGDTAKTVGDNSRRLSGISMNVAVNYFITALLLFTPEIIFYVSSVEMGEKKIPNNFEMFCYYLGYRLLKFFQHLQGSVAIFSSILKNNISQH